MNATFSVKNSELSKELLSFTFLELRKSQRNAKLILDYNDMNQLFKDKKLPVLRTIVKEIVDDP